MNIIDRWKLKTSVFFILSVIEKIVNLIIRLSKSNTLDKKSNKRLFPWRKSNE